MNFPNDDRTATCSVYITEEGIAIESATGKCLYVWRLADFDDDNRKLLNNLIDDLIMRCKEYRKDWALGMNIKIPVTVREMTIFKYLVDDRTRENDRRIKNYRRKDKQ